MTIKDLTAWGFGKKDMPIRREEEHPFLSLHSEMNRLFDEFSRGFNLAPIGFGEEKFGSFSPSVNVADKGKEVEISLELPGVDEKDIEVSVTNDLLTIKGEKKEEKEEQKKGYYRKERSFGSFQRSISLPAGTDEGKAEATFKKGVLTITLPKTKEAQKETKKIQIKSG